MHALLELQYRLRDGIAGFPEPALLDRVEAHQIAADRRLAIHRNHLYSTLVDVLAATFPAVRSAVGERPFRAVAYRYAAAQPPQQPCLHEYGATFADFIAGEAAFAAIAWLADMARFEWAINEAYHARDVRSGIHGRISALPAERSDAFVVAFHPSFRLFASAYPLTGIRTAIRWEPDCRLDWAASAENLLLWRRGDDVVWRDASAPEFAFARSLAAGKPIGADFTPGCEALLTELIATGAVVDVALPTNL